MSPQPIYELQDVVKTYNHRVVLDIPCLAFKAAAMYALVGPNGAGKSTLLRILSFLEKPTDGSVHFNGQRVSYSSNGLSALRRQVTYVLQDPLLFRTTVMKNITYGLWIRGMQREERLKKARDILDAFGLNDLADTSAQQLSGGEIQRVAIARALATDPRVLLLDEPTANLDRSNASIINETLKEINVHYGTTVLFATHNLKQAYRCTDNIVSLLGGRIVEGRPDNVFKGTVIEKDGRKWFSIHQGAGFFVAADNYGASHASIDPREIIVSREPLCSSALNCLRGHITGIDREGHLVRLTADAGVPLVSVITMDSFSHMNLNINSEVYLTFKATSVEMY